MPLASFDVRYTAYPVPGRRSAPAVAPGAEGYEEFLIESFPIVEGDPVRIVRDGIDRNPGRVLTEFVAHREQLTRPWVDPKSRAVTRVGDGDWAGLPSAAS